MVPFKIFTAFTWIIKKFLSLFVKVRVLTNDLEKHLEIDKTKPVCYVLENRSIADLLVLEKLVETYGLPTFDVSLDESIIKGKSTYLYLTKPGILGSRKVKIEKKLSSIVNCVNTTTSDIQLIPVSIFWGRNPGKEDSSFIRALMFDSRRGGLWQKFLAIVFNGRHTLANFGKPVSVDSLLREGRGEEQTSKKIYRLLRVHFNRQSISILGPELYNRNMVINKIVRTESVRLAIADLMNKKGLSREKAEASAIKYVDEIASDHSFKMIFIFDKMLKWLWQKVYKGVELRNEHYLNEIKNAGDTIVYMPTHKSHMDYLLVCYVLYFHGMMSPHTAAGINLNFWPAGPILRKAGAFFLRRSFKGDRLYAACFNEYLYYLVNKGFPINFFPEGGRSRSGRLLKPKTGMLSMVMAAQQRMPERNITLVPVYISYDKIAEGKSYENELKGEKKKSESVGQLVQARKILKSKMGKAYVSFGKPQKLRDYFDSTFENWDKQEAPGERPKWISSGVNSLATNMMARTNASVIVSPVSIVSLSMLSAPNRALTKESFQGLRNIYYKWLKEHKYDDNTAIEEESFENSIQIARELAGLEILSHPLGDILHVSEKKTMRLSYYSNTVLHLFAIPSLVSYMFIKKHKRSIDEVIEGCELLYPFLKREFFLKWTNDELKDRVKECVSFFVENGILDPEENGQYSGPELAEVNYTYLQTTAGILHHVFQYYSTAMLLLAEGSRYGKISRDTYDKQLDYLVERMSLLSGDSLAFRTIGSYKMEFNLQMIESRFSVLTDDGTLEVSDILVSKSELIESLLDKGLRSSVKKISQILKPEQEAQ